MTSDERVLGSTGGGMLPFACGVVLQAYGETLSQPSVASAVGRLPVVRRPACLGLTGFHADTEPRKQAGPALGPATAPIGESPSLRCQRDETENAALPRCSDLLRVPCLALVIQLPA